MPALLVGPEGDIAASNAAADALAGLALTGQPHVAVLRRPELLDAIARARSELRPIRARLVLAQPGRDAIWQISASPAGAGRPPAVLVVFEDRTALEAAEQMRRDFVANVSHELKTPLTALMGFIETLADSARDDPAARTRFLAIMAQEAQRMDRLVAGLLSLSRLEQDERVRPTAPVDLVALVQRTLAVLRPQLDAAGARLDLALPAGPLQVAGDADQLQQVLTNLLENALRYGRPRGRIALHLTPPAAPGGLVRLSVRDEGEGIEPHHLPRLGERFYRVDSHRSRATGGTGLGLAIVKHIVSRHRGRLEIASRPGEGACFSVLLPMLVTGEAGD